VSKNDVPHEAGFDEESSRLAEGLKNCRSVVKNYRAMIANPPLIAREPDLTGQANDAVDGS